MTAWLIAGFSPTVFLLKSVKFHSPENKKKLHIPYSYPHQWFLWLTAIATLYLCIPPSTCLITSYITSLVETAFSNQSIQILIELAPCKKTNISVSKDQHSWYRILCVLYLTELFISSDYTAAITWWIVNTEMVRMWAGTITAWSRHYIRICLEGLRKNICQGCQDSSIQTLPVLQCPA